MVELMYSNTYLLTHNVTICFKEFKIESQLYTTSLISSLVKGDEIDPFSMSKIYLNTIPSRLGMIFVVSWNKD